MSPALDNGFPYFSKPHTPVKKHHDGFGTRAIHVGSEPSSETGAVIPAISLSTTYQQDGIGIHKGYEYSRSGNPNRNALESTLASVEAGGAVAIAFASGSATTATVLQSLGHGAHIISVNDVYGGTFRYMTRVAAQNQGLQTTFMDLENASDDQILAAIRPNTKLIWIESPTNPTLRLIDIKRISSLVHSPSTTTSTGARPLVLVDNTFLSPFYSSPLLLGADIVMHSLTKYINGHSDVVMGALILPSHHAAPGGVADDLRFLQNAIGAVPSAFDSWLAQRGMKTLQLRMKAHGENALRVARALQSRVGVDVEDVVYPGLKSHRRNGLAYSQLAPHAKKFVDGYLERNRRRIGRHHWNGGGNGSDIESDGSVEGVNGVNGVHTEEDYEADEEDDDGSFPFGGMVSFRIKGGQPEAERFLTSLRLFTLAESLGGVESLAEHPAMMTHGSIPPQERALLGIGDNLIRLSVGVEDGEDLVRDVIGALKVAVGGGSAA